MTAARPWHRDAALAAAAAAELVAREKHYPGMIERGEITRPAAIEDQAAWRAIAELLDRGTIDHGLTWTDLLLALGRALVSRRTALADKPADAYLATRLDNVEAIHAQCARSERATRMAA